MLGLNRSYRQRGSPGERRGLLSGEPVQPPVSNSTNPPGKGILIDPQQIIDKKEDIYYIVYNGHRIHGATPEGVLQKLQQVDNANLAKYPRNTGKSGVGTLVNINKAKSGSADKYFIVVKGKRYYGRSPDDAVQRAQGVKYDKSKTRWQRAKNLGRSAVNATRKGIGYAASGVKSGLRGVRSTWSRGAPGRQAASNATRRRLGSAGTAISKGVRGIGKRATRAVRAFRNQGTAGPGSSTLILVNKVNDMAKDYKKQPDAKRGKLLLDAIANLRNKGDSKYHKSNRYVLNNNGADYKTMDDTAISRETGIDAHIIKEATRKVREAYTPQRAPQVNNSTGNPFAR